MRRVVRLKLGTARKSWYATKTRMSIVVTTSHLCREVLVGIALAACCHTSRRCFGPCLILGSGGPRLEPPPSPTLQGEGGVTSCRPSTTNRRGLGWGLLLGTRLGDSACWLVARQEIGLLLCKIFFLVRKCFRATFLLTIYSAYRLSRTSLFLVIVYETIIISSREDF